MLHNFRVAARDGDTGFACRIPHGTHFDFKHRRRQPGLKHISDDHDFCLRSRHRQIVHSSVHSNFSDGPSRETQRLDHKTVCGDSDLGTVEIKMGRISQRL